MGLQFNVRSQEKDNLTLELKFEEGNVVKLPKAEGPFLPAEWYPQSGVQLTWPHKDTDWCDLLPQVTECYVRMAYEIASREKLLIVTPEKEAVEKLLSEKLPANVLPNILWMECPTNDTWARDHGFITCMSEQGAELLDFRFNGWGMKFAANHDNQINRRLFAAKMVRGDYRNHLGFVLEGGAIESDGEGTILTTSPCLLAPNRNEPKSREEIEEYLKQAFHAKRVLWLDHGYLAGDDTDSHVDTLARLCPNDTIAYVQCTDKDDEHYEELYRMEEQLKEFRTLEGEPYKLVPLPMADAAFDEDGQRLPATYANFLILNDAVLMPTYNQPVKDELALKQLQKAFPKHCIVGIDCRVLIEQHGSLHCCTMQYPAGVL